jgi:hypothetical protein
MKESIFPLACWDQPYEAIVALSNRTSAEVSGANAASCVQTAMRKSWRLDGAMVEKNLPRSLSRLRRTHQQNVNPFRDD